MITSHRSSETSRDLQKEKLFSIGVSADCLSTSAQSDLIAIAEVACVLGLRTTAPCPTLARVADIHERKWALQQRQAQANSLLEELDHKTKLIEGLSEQLSEIQRLKTNDYGDAEKALLSHEHNIQLALIKAGDYEEQADGHNKRLKLYGYKPSLQHHELLRRSQSIQAKQKAAVQLSARLSAYKDLPTDLEGAKRQHNEAVNKLHDLETHFTALLESV